MGNGEIILGVGVVLGTGMGSSLGWWSCCFRETPQPKQVPSLRTAITCVIEEVRDIMCFPLGGKLGI